MVRANGGPFLQHHGRWYSQVTGRDAFAVRHFFHRIGSFSIHIHLQLSHVRPVYRRRRQVQQRNPAYGDSGRFLVGFRTRYGCMDHA